MLRRGGIAVLFALLCWETARRGPLSLRAPATVFSNAGPVLQATEPYVLFLRWVASGVPEGSTVAVLTSEKPNTGPTYLLAVGQLPGREVWPLVRMGGGDAAVEAEWVASFFTIFEDPRYRRVGSYPNGSLFRRVR